MAHSLYITYSGGTVNLNSGTIGGIRMMEQYVPRMGDGETTVDSVQLEFSGTAVSQIQTSIQNIQKAMREAVEYTKVGTGNTRVYANFQPDGYTEAWRSELVPASVTEWKLELDNDALGAARWGTISPVKKVQGLLTWTRCDWWEKSGAELNTNFATNGNTVDALYGVNVYNCNDNAVIDINQNRKNYLSIAGTSIVGDLPALANFVITTYENHELIHIGHGVGRDMDIELEGEASTAGGTKTATTSASGGTVMVKPLPPSAETLLFSWTDAILFDGSESSETYMANMPYKVIGFFAPTSTFTPTNTRFRSQFYDGATSEVIWQGDLNYPTLGGSVDCLELGVITMPDDANVALDFRITGYQTTGGTVNVNLDRVLLMPLDSYIVFNDIKQIGTTAYYPSMGYVPLYAKVTTGDVYLIPGKTQYLHFAMQNTGGTVLSTNKKVKVNVAYRPRRRTL